MSDEEFDRELRDALVRKGWVIPTTPREVLIAEDAMKDEPPAELPESLRDPREIIRKHPEVFDPPKDEGGECSGDYGYCDAHGYH